MSFDEILFSSLGQYFRQRREKTDALNGKRVMLAEVHKNLTLLATALSGEAIEILPADREGGYKGNT
ncbi:MAG TPA: hypothetical protein PLP34_05065, partial [Chitinophagaceae bacterium]|nr:hypothetical protein [Chitinophagaceae bacterium]